MNVSYIKLYLAEDGTFLDKQDATGEVRALRSQIAVLTQALEIEMQAVADLRELLDAVRKIAYDATEQTLKAKL